MQIVTLTTDWGTKDFFAGMVKGKLYSAIPDVLVVDITHDIEQYNIMNTAFVVKNACLNFPKGTIHIIDVNSFFSLEKDINYVVIEYNEQYFICADNKMPHAIFGDECTTIIEIATYWDSNFYNFVVYDLFCKVAALIANGTPLDEIGYRRERLNQSQAIAPICDNNSIKANVMYVDSYGNAYLNIKYEEFMAVAQNRPFKLMLQSGVHQLTELCSSYNEAKSNSDLVVTVSSTGYIQIAMKIASAEQLLNLKERDQVIIIFN